MYKGYMNKFLKIDLSTEKYSFSTPPPELFEKFIGGKGMGLKLLIDMGIITQDPLSPENPLIFTTGPFTGSQVQTSARSTLVTKSPLTGTFLDSHMGGNWGPALKRSGIDYLIITGRSEKPVYLHISPEKVEFILMPSSKCCSDKNSSDRDCQKRQPQQKQDGFRFFHFHSIHPLLLY